MKVDVFKHAIKTGKHQTILNPESKNLEEAFRLLEQMPKDFMSDVREDSLPQDRESFLSDE